MKESLELQELRRLLRAGFNVERIMARGGQSASEPESGLEITTTTHGSHARVRYRPDAASRADSSAPVTVTFPSDERFAEAELTKGSVQRILRSADKDFWDFTIAMHPSLDAQGTRLLTIQPLSNATFPHTLRPGASFDVLSLQDSFIAEVRKLNPRPNARLRAVVSDQLSRQFKGESHRCRTTCGARNSGVDGVLLGAGLAPIFRRNVRHGVQPFCKHAQVLRRREADAIPDALRTCQSSARGHAGGRYCLI